MRCIKWKKWSISKLVKYDMPFEKEINLSVFHFKRKVLTQRNKIKYDVTFILKYPYHPIT